MAGSPDAAVSLDRYQRFWDHCRSDTASAVDVLRQFASSNFAAFRYSGWVKYAIGKLVVDGKTALEFVRWYTDEFILKFTEKQWRAISASIEIMPSHQQYLIKAARWFLNYWQREVSTVSANEALAKAVDEYRKVTTRTSERLDHEMLIHIASLSREHTLCDDADSQQPHVIADMAVAKRFGVSHSLFIRWRASLKRPTPSPEKLHRNQ